MKKKTFCVSQDKADRIALVVELHPQWTQAEIANFLHIAVPTVRAAIRQYKIPYLSKGKKTIDWSGRSENYRAIVTLELAAREHGLSYGKYVAERKKNQYE